MKKRIIFILVSLLLPAASLHAAISSVTLTPAPPTTLSNGNSYYLAGVPYTFRVQAVDTAATGIADWTTIQITFPSGENILYNINTPASTTTSGVIFDAPAVNNTSVYTNIDFIITVRFRWDSADYPAASRNVTATVVNVNGATAFDDAIATFSFGKSSSIRVVNFAQSGVAADGYINGYHSAFNVTGTIVYNVTGATAADTVESKAPDEIDVATDIALYRNGTLVAINNTGNVENFTFAITAASIPVSATAYTWDVRVSMDTGPATEITTNTLSLVCDNIIITGITFSGGGGITTPPTYYRSVNVPNTLVTIQATKQLTGGNMIGTTTITVSDGTLPTFTVTIPDNGNTGTANIKYPALAQTPDGRTTPISYQVTAVSGSVFDSEQDTAGEITQVASPAILWDRNDPPGRNGPPPNYHGDPPGSGETPFTDAASFTVNPVTATSFTLNWQPLTALGDPPYDGDFGTFGSYRIYYRASDPPGGIWTIVDQSTPGYGTTGTYNLNDPTRTTATITGLVPLTQYDYFMTAVDVFGQEVEHPIPNSGNNSDALYAGAPTPMGYGQITTNPTEISASVTDGITEYAISRFETSGPIDASARPLRKTSIRVRVYIVSAGDQPDSVNVILAQDNGTGSAGSDLYIGPGLTTTITYDRIACSKIAPNTWDAYIPSGNRFLIEGQFCRFIIESIRSGTETYSDTNSTSDGDPNNYEYTFMVQTPTTFKPWPTRVLNNVLTDKNPVCYPSYYLSDDAYVTITAYDIKGRPVATLIDNGFRKGGQNIKEGGWSGKNKARKKLGVGLYYIRFEAKRARDGKIILNETEKVVIAK
ncbi:MAG: fibronectin type III domain-containing protein [Spirochaetes bacterium]|nr:fibronectin type III domain-containing protein [Spirochaetota bacterium]